MAREKKSMIGFDPLAWLDDDKSESAKKSTHKKNTNKNNLNKNNLSKKTKSIISLLDRTIDEMALIKGYELLEKTDFEVIKHTIYEVFSKHADINKIFEGRDIEVLSNNINHAIKLIIELRQDEASLKNELKNMANSCQLQGVVQQSFSIATQYFLTLSKELVGRSWTKAVSAAWNELLTGVTQTICADYKDDLINVENIEMETAVMSDNVETDKNTMDDNSIADGRPVLLLNSVQDISKSQALKNDMLRLINDNDEISINASDVERIDGSALQLLCALFNYAHQNNLEINWINPSDALKHAANTLGMQNILELT